MHLADDSRWHALVHYRDTFFGVESPVDDIRFFAAGRRGMTDPEAELAATIDTFFWPANSEAEHMRCRFIARWEFLKTALSIDESRLPAVACTDYLEATESIAAESVHLVFPTAYLNNPASMFGHTFLRIDSAERDALMANAVNFSAVTASDSQGFFYALKGVFGFYPGYYSVQPYYEKVNEYNDMNQRDMWEYRLNFTPEEAEWMVRHVWELKDIYTDYYFFDENCSYHLLFVMEAGRPELSLTDDFGWWVVPSDTVQGALARDIVTDVTYRPSPKSRIEHMVSLLSHDGAQALRELNDGRMTPEDVAALSLPVIERQAVLDAGAAYLRYRFTAGEVPDEEYRDAYMRILRVRATLGETPAGRYDVPPPPRPDKGHDTSRFRIGGGSFKGAEFAEIGWRPAYHDLMDDDTGFSAGSKIVFLDTTARYFEETGTLYLERVDVVDVTSISPRSALFKPKSWRMMGGVKRVMLEDGDRVLVGRGNFSGGLAWGGGDVPLFFMLAEAEIEAAGALDEDYALGGGFRAGLIRQFGRTAKIGIEARAMDFPFGHDHAELSATASLRLFLGANAAFRAEFEAAEESDIATETLTLGIDLYY